MKQSETAIKATIVNYFDVWGNENDGWEVNNLCEEGEVDLPEQFTHADILKALRQAKFLKSGVGLNQCTVDDLYPYYEICQKKDGMPVCRIQIHETE